MNQHWARQTARRQHLTHGCWRLGSRESYVEFWYSRFLLTQQMSPPSRQMGSKHQPTLAGALRRGSVQALKPRKGAGVVREGECVWQWAQGWRRGGKAHAACPPTLAAQSPRMNPPHHRNPGRSPLPRADSATRHSSHSRRVQRQPRNSICVERRPGWTEQRHWGDSGLEHFGTALAQAEEQHPHHVRSCFACTVSQAWLCPHLIDEETEAQRAQDCTASKR